MWRAEHHDALDCNRVWRIVASRQDRLQHVTPQGLWQHVTQQGRRIGLMHVKHKGVGVDTQVGHLHLQGNLHTGCLSNTNDFTHEAHAREMTQMLAHQSHDARAATEVTVTERRGKSLQLYRVCNY
jgi:hypothetical protein